MAGSLQVVIQGLFPSSATWVPAVSSSSVFRLRKEGHIARHIRSLEGPGLEAAHISSAPIPLAIPTYVRAWETRSGHMPSYSSVSMEGKNRLLYGWWYLPQSPGTLSSPWIFCLFLIYPGRKTAIKVGRNHFIVPDRLCPSGWDVEILVPILLFFSAFWVPAETETKYIFITIYYSII